MKTNKYLSYEDYRCDSCGKEEPGRIPFQRPLGWVSTGPIELGKHACTAVCELEINKLYKRENLSYYD